MILVVFTTALIFGLIGFAAHALWVVAIIIIATGLGYPAANSHATTAMRSTSGRRTS